MGRIRERRPCWPTRTRSGWGRPPEADAAEGGKEGAGAPPEPSLCPSAGPTARTGPLRWPKARLAHGPGGLCILWQGESAAGPGRTAGRAVALTAASLANGLPPSRPARAGLSLPLARAPFHGKPATMHRTRAADTQAAPPARPSRVPGPGWSHVFGASAQGPCCLCAVRGALNSSASQLRHVAHRLVKERVQ